jgi:hypothetical protein
MLRQAGHEEFGICGPIDVAGIAADPGLARHAAENGRRVEGDVTELDQIGADAFDGFGAELLARHVERILVELGARRQDGLVAV